MRLRAGFKINSLESSSSWMISLIHSTIFFPPKFTTFLCTAVFGSLDPHTYRQLTKCFCGYKIKAMLSYRDENTYTNRW